MQRSGNGSNPMRQRFREQVREDVKDAALRQLALGGASAVSVNAIARELGVSGPALYRYFSSRDELLAELILDAYNDFADSLAATTDRELGLSPQDRLRALTRAWRSFALAEPHRYRLLFAPPVPGYDAHAESLVRASSRAMAVGLDVYKTLATTENAPSYRSTEPSESPTRRVPASLPQTDLSTVSGFSEEVLTATGAGPEELLCTISVWIRVHGFVSLEIGGNFSSMGIDADALFDHEVDALLSDHGPVSTHPDRE